MWATPSLEVDLDGPWLEILSVVVPGLFLVVGLAMGIRGRDRAGFGVALFALVMLGFMGPRLVNQARQHHRMETVVAAQVQSITLGRQVLDDPARIAPVVDALHQHQWFSPNHESWNPTWTLALRLDDGERWQWRVGWSEKRQAAVVQFSRPLLGGQLRDGQALVPGLIEALEDAGLETPRGR